MRKPAKRRSSHFEFSGLPGLESRRLLSADFPINFAEVGESHKPEQPMRFEESREFGMPPKPAMVSTRDSYGQGGRMSDSMLVRPAFDAFRQIPGGPDRFATTVGDSLSVKFGTPMGTSSAEVPGAAWSATTEIGTTDLSGVTLSPSSGSTISLAFATAEKLFRVPMTDRIHFVVQVNPNSYSKSDRVDTVPLIPPSSSAILLPVAPDAQSTTPATMTVQQAATSENSAQSLPEGTQAPNRPLPPGDPGRSEPSNRSIHEEIQEFAVVPASARSEEMAEVRFQRNPESIDRSITHVKVRQGTIEHDPDIDENATEKPQQEAIWSRISEAFGIDDSDFGSLGTQPLDEPVEIDADELSAAVDRIIDGFAQPVEGAIGGSGLGKSIGLAAGVAIAVQIYARRRRCQDESSAVEDDDRADLMTHVSPQLDQLNESDH